MARFAPVMPISVAQYFKRAETLGDYHLLLAHDVAAKQEDYHNCYSQITSRADGIIIMDNSVVELGTPVDAATMEAAVDAVHANIIVLSDHLLDRNKTVEAVARSVDEYARLLEGHDERYLMAIPQGNSLLEWILCLEDILMLDLDGVIDWIGIPKNLNEKLGISRKDAIDAVRTVCPDKNCHMFGFSDDLYDDITSTIYGADLELVWGIDSAAPIWSGMRDGHMLRLGQNIPNRRGNWWDMPFSTMPGNDDRAVMIAISNVDTVRHWLMP